jgi:hypothetical protein
MRWRNKTIISYWTTTESTHRVLINIFHHRVFNHYRYLFDNIILKISSTDTLSKILEYYDIAWTMRGTVYLYPCTVFHRIIATDIFKLSAIEFNNRILWSQSVLNLTWLSYAGDIESRSAVLEKQFYGRNSFKMIESVSWQSNRLTVHCGVTANSLFRVREMACNEIVSIHPP